MTKKEKNDTGPEWPPRIADKIRPSIKRVAKFKWAPEASKWCSCQFSCPTISCKGLKPLLASSAWELIALGMNTCKKTGMFRVRSDLTHGLTPIPTRSSKLTFNFVSPKILSEKNNANPPSFDGIERYRGQDQVETFRVALRLALPGLWQTRTSLYLPPIPWGKPLTYNWLIFLCRVDLLKQPGFLYHQDSFGSIFSAESRDVQNPQAQKMHQVVARSRLHCRKLFVIVLH